MVPKTGMAGSSACYVAGIAFVALKLWVVWLCPVQAARTDAERACRSPTTWKALGTRAYTIHGGASCGAQFSPGHCDTGRLIAP